MRKSERPKIKSSPNTSYTFAESTPPKN